MASALVPHSAFCPHLCFIGHEPSAFSGRTMLVLGGASLKDQTDWEGKINSSSALKVLIWEKQRNLSSNSDSFLTWLRNDEFLLKADFSFHHCILRKWKFPLTLYQSLCPEVASSKYPCLEGDINLFLEGGLFVSSGLDSGGLSTGSFALLVSNSGHSCYGAWL